MTSLTLVVAATLSNGIGKSSRLPWRLPQELAYFAHVTSSAPEGSTNVVIMGRNTWESIPPKFRPLPRRLNVVVSRNSQYLKINSLSEASSARTFLQPSLPLAIASFSGQSEGEPQIHRRFIIGGASLYEEALSLPKPTDATQAVPDRILLTRILSPSFDDCDVFMPEFRSLKTEDGRPLWRQATHEELEEWVGREVPKGVQEEKGVQYEFQMWTRTD